MFERFTHAAREAVVHAQEEARGAGARSVGAPHLLVGAAPAVPGLAPEPLRAALAESSPAAALASIGIDLDEVRRRVEEHFGPGALPRGRRARAGRRGLRGVDHLSFTPAAKRALEGALREAVEHGDRHIAAGHVVLGVLRTEDPAVLGVLQRAGLDPERVRALALAARDPD
jgi:ATP-dependent Clp protease ATP-binding subunit ClpA